MAVQPSGRPRVPAVSENVPAAVVVKAIGKVPPLSGAERTACRMASSPRVPVKAIRACVAVGGVSFEASSASQPSDASALRRRNAARSSTTAPETVVPASTTSMPCAASVAMPRPTRAVPRAAGRTVRES